MKKVYVLDTTLRDGEQVPGAKLNLNEKLEIAKQLEKLKVDFMEVGFPSSSPGDFESVQKISRLVKQSTIVALGRAVTTDIDAMYQSIKDAESPMIHIVLGTSDIHISKKFKKTPEQILAMGVDSVKYAKKYVSQVQYSLEDASRTDFEYMWKTIEAVVKAGATCINVPDTVGFAIPEMFGNVIAKVYDRLMNISPNVLLSVHCHNDSGLATANTLVAVKNGANKVECTINGIGERAGNAALEEVVMFLKLHPEYYDAYTDINYKAIYETSRIISGTMGLDIQVNKAIVGENAFAHSSGIHQDGLIKSNDVYEIINPEDIGAPNMEIVLTARSGKNAFKYVANKLGFHIQEDKLEMIHQKFLEIADERKEIYDNDVVDILENEEGVEGKKCVKLWTLNDFQVVINSYMPSATIKMQKDNDIKMISENGKGAIDALYSAIIKAVDKPIKLIDYRIHNLGRGKESLGKVVVQILYEDQVLFGKAIEQDVIKASALALINGINKIDLMK